jgi:hypothetical protein
MMSTIDFTAGVYAAASEHSEIKEKSSSTAMFSIGLVQRAYNTVRRR